MRNGEVSKIITFDGYSPEEVQALAQLIRESEQRLDSVHPLYGEERMSRKPKRLMLGATGGVNIHDIMPKPAELEAMEYYRLGIQGIAGVYGAQLIFIAQEQSRGQSAATAIRIEIQNRTIEEIQRDKEEILTNQLFPIFGITDYKFAFGELEKKDELRDAQIDQTKASTAATLVNAGFTVVIDDEKNLSFSGEVDGTEFVQSRFQPFGNPTVGETQQKPRVSDATGREIQGTSVERWPSGTRPPRTSKGYQPIVITKEPERTEHVIKVVPEAPLESEDDVKLREMRMRLLKSLMEDEE